jgi:hypothetical protein
MDAGNGGAVNVGRILTPYRRASTSAGRNTDATSIADRSDPGSPQC